MYPIKRRVPQPTIRNRQRYFHQRKKKEDLKKLDEANLIMQTDLRDIYLGY